MSDKYVLQYSADQDAYHIQEQEPEADGSNGYWTFYIGTENDCRKKMLQIIKQQRAKNVS